MPPLRLPRPALASPLVLLAALAAPARKLEVGPGKTYATPSAAASAAQAGDTVEIAPGVYPKDVATWRANNLVLRATAKYAHLRADGAHAGGKGIWVIAAHDVTVENIEFSGAKVPDENGAGIRIEGRNLKIRNCYFHDNENGILGGAGHLVIENTEFFNNGFGDGFTHNMYVSPADTFTLIGSFTHHARIGHNVKSRAKVNRILYNRITDDADGTASYNIDLPNGGVAYIIGNVIQQSPNSDNTTLVSWGAEGLNGTDNRVYISHNTLVNDMSRGTFISLSGTPSVAKAVNNLFVGPGTLFSGKLDTLGNLLTQSPAFVDRAAYDYRLTAGSPAVDKGKNPGAGDSASLIPAQQYVHPAAVAARPVQGAIDVGAFEYSSGNPVRSGGRTGKAGPQPGRGHRLPGLYPVWISKAGNDGILDVVTPLGSTARIPAPAPLH